MFAIPGGAFFEFGIGNSTSSWFELGGPPQFPVGPEVGPGPGKPPLFAPLHAAKMAATESRAIRSGPLGFLMV
jgi:hypothetical protein